MTSAEQYAYDEDTDVPYLPSHAELQPRLGQRLATSATDPAAAAQIAALDQRVDVLSLAQVVGPRLASVEVAPSPGGDVNEVTISEDPPEDQTSELWVDLDEDTPAVSAVRLISMPVDGSTGYTELVHNLGTTDVSVTLYDTTTGDEIAVQRVTHADPSMVTVSFQPTFGSGVRAVIIG